MPTSKTTLFTHVFQNVKATKTLCLLHGTGGNEHDLLELARQVVPNESGYNLLSLRGNVVENGMNRFFARLAFGVFDQKSIFTEATKLQQFATAFSAEHSLQPKDITYLGFSNGANMILATLFLFPELIHHAVILHPMLLLQPPKALDLSHLDALVTYGTHDQMVRVAESQAVVSALKKARVNVSVVAHTQGHNVTAEEVKAVTAFLSK